MIQLYHNPRCGKSRSCLVQVAAKEQEVTIIKYLDNPLSKDEITELLKKLNFTPLQLVRVKEKIWMQNYSHKTLTDEEILQAMVEHPILMERPIVVKGNQAIIGRNPEELAQFLL